MSQWIAQNVGLFTAIVVIITLIPSMAVSIWLYRRFRGPRMKDGVQGTLSVTAAGALAGGATWANTTVIGVINCPGHTPAPVERKILAPRAKWPSPGQQLPVMVDPIDPTKFRILWDAVPAARDIAGRQAAELAHQGGVPNAIPTFPDGALSGTSEVFTSTTINGQPVSGTVIDPSAITAAMHGDPSALIAALEEQGQPGTGIVGGYTGPDGGPQVIFDLMVTPDAGGEAFPASLVVNFSPNSARRMAWCQTGARIPVRIDPGNRGQVQIDVGRV